MLAIVITQSCLVCKWQNRNLDPDLFTMETCARACCTIAVASDCLLVILLVELIKEETAPRGRCACIYLCAGLSES